MMGINGSSMDQLATQSVGPLMLAHGSQFWDVNQYIPMNISRLFPRQGHADYKLHSRTLQVC